MAKHRKSNKSIKKPKKYYSRKNKNLRKSGGCGCNKNFKYEMKGGYGPSNFSSLNTSDYYPHNLTTLPLPESSRNVIIKGGKKNKNNSNKKVKTMRGGNILPNWVTNHPFGNNSLPTGDTAGAFLGNNIINGIPNSTNSITDAPVLNVNRLEIV